MAIKETIIGLATLASTILGSGSQSLISPLGKIQSKVLVEHKIDLSKRNEDQKVNEVFAYNVLLTVEYFKNGFELEPGETFAFHETILPEFEDKTLKTGWTKYTKQEGYKTTLGLVGNGACHLASLINWTASKADLKVVSKVNHNFAEIPGVPKEHGTSIRYTPDGSLNSRSQNLYVTNNKNHPVRFEFETEGQFLTLRILGEE